MFLKWRRRKTKLNDILSKATTPRAYSTYACIGVVVTAVVTAICMHKHDKAKREEEADVDSTTCLSEMTREEVIDEIKHVGGDFAPAIASAAATIFFIKKADQKWMALNGMVSTACTMATDRLNRYRSAMPGVAAAEVLHGFAKKPPDEGKQWFCVRGMGPEDEVIYFQSTEADVISAEYHTNRNFQYRGSASVKEFFAFLGITDQLDKDELETGDYFGWDVCIMIEDWGLDFPWIDFDHRTYTDPESGEQVTEITYMWEPEFSKDGEPFACEYQHAPSGLSPHE